MQFVDYKYIYYSFSTYFHLGPSLGEYCHDSVSWIASGYYPFWCTRTNVHITATWSSRIDHDISSPSVDIKCINI